MVLPFLLDLSLNQDRWHEETPSISAIKELIEEVLKLMHMTHKQLMVRKHVIWKASVKYFESKYDAVKDTDALVIPTEWKNFILQTLKLTSTKNRIIFDGKIFSVTLI